jgi:DNA-binding MarR family transcriptional regulator
MPETLTDADYQRLLTFRTSLRAFLGRSDAHARAAGIPPSQHQLLLAIRGHAAGSDGPTIGEAATQLHISHNAAVQLVDRAQHAGLVERTRDPVNYRAVRLRLTLTGAERLAQLSTLHLEELAILEPTMRALSNQLADEHSNPSARHDAERARE